MPQENIIQVFNQNRQRLAFLQNAFNIGYRKSLNALWTATFSLPAHDPKNRHCQPFNLVELYDGKERVELFRIVGEDFTRSTRSVKVYQCEHVLATLLDDVLFQYHQIGNIGISTTMVINYVLNQQTTQNWRLGVCDFTRFFEYKFENENLLAALYSIPRPFTEQFIWDFDTTSYPWTINLRLLGNDVKSEIRYGKNMTEIVKETDATNVITRLYCLGFGEGDNQLSIRSVNNGLPYLDAPTMAKWGMKASVLVDRRFEDVDSLKAYGQSILNAAQDPFVSYTVQAVDLHKLTGRRYDKFVVGDIVRVVDKESDIFGDFPIIEVGKSDLTGSPGDITVTIANKSRDLAGSITDLQNRALINELYAQGATNQVMVNFADNADVDNPALLKLFVPDSMVRVNSCILHFQFEPFRAYERGVESSQQSVQSTTTTSSEVFSSTSESTQTHAASTQSQQTPTTTWEQTQTQTTDSTPASTPTTSTTTTQHTSTDNGGSSTPTSNAVSLLPQNMQDNSGGGFGAANHNHGITHGTHVLTSVNFANQTFTSLAFAASGAHTHGEHSHTVNIPNHSHNFAIPGHSHTVTVPSHNHTVTIPGHSHNVTIPSHSHTVTIPGHSHLVTIPGHGHTVTIPAHTHAMLFGIFKTGGASVGRLYVNGRFIQNVSPNTNINLADMLANPNTGKINRNVFHRIEIFPVATSHNPQALTRIVANVFLQIFTNSRGAGDF